MRTSIQNSTQNVVLGNGRVRGIVAVADAVRRVPDMVRHLFARFAHETRAKLEALSGKYLSLAYAAEPAMVSPAVDMRQRPTCWSPAPAARLRALRYAGYSGVPVALTSRS
jgi:hypothetical protein